jgi:carboxylesterase type B
VQVRIPSSLIRSCEDLLTAVKIATQEGTLFSLVELGDPSIDVEQTSYYTTFLQDNFGNYSSTIEKAFPLSMFSSTSFPTFYAISYIFTQVNFYYPSRRFVEATVQADIPAWAYIFAHQPTCGWSSGINKASTLELLGATHTSEIPFVFGELTNLPAPNGTCAFTTQEDAISNAMVTAWTAMASYGNPNGLSSSNSYLFGTTWPQFNTSASLGMLVTNTTSIAYLNYTQCDLLDSIYTTVAGLGPAGSHGIITGTAPKTNVGAQKKVFMGTLFAMAIGVSFIL